MQRAERVVLLQFGLAQAGEFERAYAAGETAAELDPDSGEPHFHRACYYSRGGMLDEALDQLAMAVERDESLAARALQDTDLTPLREMERFLAITGGE